MILSPIQPTDPIIGPSRGAADGWIDWITRHRAEVKRPDDAIAFIRAVYELCAPDDMPDAFIAAAQSFHETGNYTSQWWAERLNPAGIGVTGDDTQNAASPTFATPMQAARAMVAHDLLYATGAIDRGGLKPSDDPRYLAYRDEYGSSVFPTLQLLAGRWAADPFYANKIADRQQAIYPMFSVPVEPPAGGDAVGETIVFGRVPHPEYVDNPIWKAEGNGQNDLGKRTVKGVVWHRMIGSLWGTNSYFAQPSTAALTDYGVGTAAQDGAANDGIIIRWNDPLGHQSGWASGPVSSPYGDGKAFLDKYAGPSGIGANVVNRDQASVEISGASYSTPLSQAAKHAVAAITAYWADQYRIPWNVFPIAPQDGFSFVRWHQEFTIGTGKVCPGEVVMDATPEMIAMTQAVLKQWQVADVPDPKPEPPPSIYPPGMSKELASAFYGSVSVSWASKPFVFDPDRSECRAWLARGKAQLKDGQRYDAATWPMLVKVTRRYKDKSVHAYQFSDGFVFEKQVR